MGKETYEQLELFIPDEDRPGTLTANPDALVEGALAKRAYDMMPRAAERDRQLANLALSEAIRSEHDDNNPYKVPDPADLARIRRAFAPEPKKPTIAQQNANERAHRAQARRQRRGK